jgi:hypothetical protein
VVSDTEITERGREMGEGWLPFPAEPEVLEPVSISGSIGEGLR